VLLSLAGCSKHVDVDLTTVSGPAGSSLEGDHLTLASGTALVFDAHPKENGNDSTEGVDVVAIAPFESLPTTTKNRFVVLANAPGHASIRISVAGKDVRTLDADAL
jgi:hypothetical protein